MIPSPHTKVITSFPLKEKPLNGVKMANSVLCASFPTLLYTPLWASHFLTELIISIPTEMAQNSNGGFVNKRPGSDVLTLS